MTVPLWPADCGGTVRVLQKEWGVVMTIKELIRKSELAMDQQSQNVVNVGNRPHYPMFILYNDDFSTEELEIFAAKLERIWPQTLEQLVQYIYILDAPEQVSFCSIPDRERVSVEEVTSALDRAKMARETFSSMRQWCLYNIINTRSFTSVDQFIAHYQAQDCFRKIVVDAAMSMLIVLLDDSSLRRSVAGKIRAYLAEHSQYNSTIVIATRNRNNEMYPIEELYRIAADILLISNNDTSSLKDDTEYKKQTSTLYNGGTYTISYILTERPSQKIAIQIQAALLKHMKEQINVPLHTDLNYWNKGFSFENFKNPICEEFISDQRLYVDTEIFEYLPLKREALEERGDIASLPYSKVKRYTFGDAFDALVAAYSKKHLDDVANISRCVEKFRVDTLSRFSAVALRQLTDEMIGQIIGQLYAGSADENEPLPQYFEKQLYIYLRKELIYPRFAQVLRELRDCSPNTLRDVARIEQDYQKIIPADLFEDIGTMYENAAVNYLRGDSGQRQMARILSAGNGYDEILEQMLACFTDMIQHNKELFSLPFIEEWGRRLDLTGNRIYHEISTALTSEVDDVIRLYGYYPLDKRMKVYMLHSTDAAGKNPTQLYTSLQETFAGDDTVQYFNTGYDDALEAITFVACEGKNLLLF